MAVFTCKRCGGTLEIQEGEHIAKCLYCGTLQTLPNLDDEKRENLYNRASQFRRNNEYDKAMALYNKILEEDPEDAEAYWGVILCKYGIEYVEDPTTHERKPTINRMQMTSILADEDYKQVLKHAHPTQKQVYIDDAEEIARIQKGILEISSKEKPFDVFICYKETDRRGMRTIDSVLAQDIYKELTKEGLKVFFSRITLEDKLGEAYEPYIFAALNSAKVMIVVGTKAEHFDAVWVKNEWSRYLALINNGENKTLIPAYRDMDPYDIPIELQHIQAQDMGKIGFMQDLVRGVKKIVGVDKIKANKAVAGGTETMMKRAEALLAEGNFKEADKCAERILDIDFENADAYMIKLFVAYDVKNIKELEALDTDITINPLYEKAYRYAGKELKAELDEIGARLRLAEEHKNELIYKSAEEELDKDNLEEALRIFISLGDFRDAKKKKYDIESEIAYRAIMNDMPLATNEENINTLLNRAVAIEGYKDIDDIVKKLEKKKLDIKNRSKKITITVVAVVAAIVLIVVMSYVTGTCIIPAIHEGKINPYLEKGDLVGALKVASDMGDAALVDKIRPFHSLKVHGIYDDYAIYKIVEGTSNEIKVQYKVDDMFKDHPSYQTTNSEGYVEHTYTHGNNVTLVNPSAEYYVFNRWQVDEMTVHVKGGVWYASLKVSAVFDPEMYEIIYNFDGGYRNDNPEYYDATVDTPLGYPLRAGYDFLGWTGTDIMEITKDVIIPMHKSGERTYTAHWEPKKYNVTLEDIGTFGTQTINVTFGSYVTLPVPTTDKAGYEFAGWYDGDIKVEDGEWAYAQDVHLTAKWQPKKYDVTYSDTDIHDINVRYECGDYYTYGGFDKVYGIGDAIENVHVGPSYISGNTAFFAGWYLDNAYTTPFSFQGEYSEDMKLYAKFISMYDYNRELAQISNKYTGISETVVYISQCEEDITITVEGVDGFYINEKTDSDNNNDLGYQVDKVTIHTKVGAAYVIATNTGATKTVTVQHKALPDSTAIVVSNGTDATYAKGTNDVAKIGYQSEYTLFTPVRKGYTFLGWYVGTELIPMTGTWTREDVVLTAKWEANSYHITLDPNGGSVDKTQIDTLYDGEVTLPQPSGAKTGYEFVGWYDGDTEVKSGKWSVDKDVTLVARWQAKQYNVTYKDTDVKKITVNYYGDKDNVIKDEINRNITREYSVGDKIEYIAFEHSSDFRYFLGWYKDASYTQRFDFTEDVYTDLDLYAKWSDSNREGPQIEINTTISFDTNGYAIMLFIPEKTGKVTVSVSDAGSKVNRVQRYTYSYDWIDIQYINDNTISFDATVGELYKIDMDLYGTRQVNIMAGTVARTSKAASPTGHIADYKQGASYTDTVSYDEEYSLYEPYRTGYAFGGWYYGETNVKSGAWKIDSDVELVAKWTANSYNVTFDANGGNAVDDIKAKFDGDVVLPIPTTADDSVEFAGWYLGNTEVKSGKWTIDKDVTLVAHWQTKRSIITYGDTDKYSVKVRYHHNHAEDNVVEEKIYHVGDVIENIAVDDIRFAGNGEGSGTHVFRYWSKDINGNEPYNFDSTVSEDMDLYACWSRIMSAPTLVRLTDGSKLTHRTYIFVYVADVTGNATFTVDLEGLKIDVRDNANGNELAHGVQNVTFSVVKNHTYLIYTDMIDQNKAVSLSVDNKFVNKAKVVSPNGENIVYVKGSNYIGEVEMGMSYTLPTPYRKGYRFDGWYEGNGAKLDQTGTSWARDDDFSVTPHWSANTYEVTLDLAGGSMSESTTLNAIYDSSVTLPYPTRTGYDFMGWYDGDTKVESGIWNIEGNVTLVAKWKAKQYQMVYKNIELDTINVRYVNTAPVIVSDYPYTYTVKIGDEIPYRSPYRKSAEDSVKYQYYFAGWYLDKEYTIGFNFDEEIDHDITLYSKWYKVSNNSYLGNAKHISNSSYWKDRAIYIPERDGKIKISMKHDQKFDDLSAEVYNVTNYLDAVYEEDVLKQKLGIIYRGKDLELNIKAGEIILFRLSSNLLENIFDISNSPETNNTSKVISNGSTGGKYNPSGSQDVRFTIDYGADYELFPAHRPGYTFEGWYNGSTETGEKMAMSGKWNKDYGVVLNAKWNANTYHVHFDNNGAEGNLESDRDILFGSQADIKTPTRTGYDFGGWYEGDERLVMPNPSGWSVDHDATFVAKWIPHQHSVTFKDTNRKMVTVIYHSQVPQNSGYGKEFNDVTKKYYVGDTIEYIKYPELGYNGYHNFMDWYREPEGINRFNFNEQVSQDLHLYAKWTPPASGGYYESELYIGDNIQTKSVSTIYLLYVPRVTSNVTITFSDANYIHSGRIYKNYNENISNNSIKDFESVSKVTFRAEVGNSYCIRFTSQIVQNISITSDVKPPANTSRVVLAPGEKECTYNGGHDHIETFLYGTDYTMPTPEREGYTFGGWYVDKNGDGVYDAGDTEPVVSGAWKKDSDVTLVARWCPLKYRITLDAGEGSVDKTSLDVASGETITLPDAVPNDAGLEFAGWYYNDQKINSGIWTIPGNITLVARYHTARSYVTLDDTDKNYVSVRYIWNVNHECKELTKKFYAGDMVEKLQPEDYYDITMSPAYEAFVCWYLDGSYSQPYDFDQPVMADMTLYGQYAPPMSSAGTIERLFDGTQTKSVVDYIYVADRAGEVTITTTNNEFIRVENYTTSDSDKHYGYYSLRVSARQVLRITIGDYPEMGVPKTITITHSDPFVNRAMVVVPEGEEIIYAEGTQYVEEIVKGDTYNLPTPYRKGYHFDGWYEGMTPVAISGTWNRSDEFTLTPHWSKNTYALHLDVAKGNMSEPCDQQIVYEAPFTLPTPERAGYMFEGWYDDNVRVEAGNWTFDRDLTLTARWQANKYQLVYNNTIANSVNVTYSYRNMHGEYGDHNDVITYREGEKIENIWRDVKSSAMVYEYLMYWKTSDGRRLQDVHTITEDITVEPMIAYVPYFAPFMTSRRILVDDDLGSSDRARYYIYIANSPRKVTFTSRVNGAILYKMTHQEVGQDVSDTKVETLKICTIDKDKNFTIDMQEGDVFYVDALSKGVNLVSVNKEALGAVPSQTVVGASTSRDSYDVHGEARYNVEYDSEYELIVPTREGYTFDGWYKNGTFTEENRMDDHGKWTETKGVTLTAKWVANKYNIRYNANGGTMAQDVQQVTMDDHYSLSVPSTNPNGMDFAGWYLDGQIFESGTWKITHDITLTAEWTPHLYTMTYENTALKNIRVTYHESQTKVFGDKTIIYPVGSVVEFVDYQYPGVYIQGWYKDESCKEEFLFDQPVSTDLHLYAKWANQLTAGTVIEDDVLYHQPGMRAEYTARSNTRIFVETTGGWIKDGYKIMVQRNRDSIMVGEIFEGTSTIDVERGEKYFWTMPAEWSGTMKVHTQQPFVNAAVVTADANNTIEYKLGSNAVFKYNHNDPYTLCTPTRVGYDFLAWRCDGQLMAPQYVFDMDKDIVLVADWQAKSYNVSYDAAGGNVSKTNDVVTYDEQVTLPVPTNIEPHVEFAGWYEGDTLVSSGTWSIARDVHLIAKWVPLEVAVTIKDVKINTAEVFFDTGNGVNLKRTVKLWDTVPYFVPEYPVEDGTSHVFLGWYRDEQYDQRFNFDEAIDTSTQLYAKWGTTIDNAKMLEDDVQYVGSGGTFIYVPKQTTVVEITISNTQGSYEIYENMSAINVVGRITNGRGVFIAEEGKYYTIYLNGDNISVLASPETKFVNNCRFVAPPILAYEAGSSVVMDFTYGLTYFIPPVYYNSKDVEGWYIDKNGDGVYDIGDEAIPETGTWTHTEPVTLVAKWVPKK